MITSVYTPYLFVHESILANTEVFQGAEQNQNDDDRSTTNYNKSHFGLSVAGEFPMRPWCKKQLISEFDEVTCDQPDGGA